MSDLLWLAVMGIGIFLAIEGLKLIPAFRSFYDRLSDGEKLAVWLVVWTVLYVAAQFVRAAFFIH